MEEGKEKTAPIKEQPALSIHQKILDIIEKYKDENYCGLKAALQLHFVEFNWEILSSFLLQLADTGFIRVVYCKRRVEFFELIEH